MKWTTESKLIFCNINSHLQTTHSYFKIGSISLISLNWFRFYFFIHLWVRIIHSQFTLSTIAIRYYTVKLVRVLIAVLTISVNGIYNGFPSRSRSDYT